MIFNKKPRLATGLSVIHLDDLEPTSCISSIITVTSIRAGCVVPYCVSQVRESQDRVSQDRVSQVRAIQKRAKQVRATQVRAS